MISYQVGEGVSIDGSVTLYTCPAGKKAIITATAVGNSDVITQPIATVAVGGVTLMSGYAVPAEGSTLSAIEGQILEENDAVIVTAAGGFISARVSIKEIDVV